MLAMRSDVSIRTAIVTLIVAGFLGVGGALAQGGLNPSRPAQPVFTGQDVSVAFDAAKPLLDQGKVGEARPWVNPQNGHGGMVEIMRSYEDTGRPCRDVRVSNTVDRRSVAYVVQVCRFADRGWALTG